MHSSNIKYSNDYIVFTPVLFKAVKVSHKCSLIKSHHNTVLLSHRYYFLDILSKRPFINYVDMQGGGVSQVSTILSTYISLYNELVNEGGVKIPVNVVYE